MEPLRVGVVGCGNISGIYLQNLRRFRSTEIVAVADLDPDRAQAAAEKHGVPNVLSTPALLAHPDVELVLNLTIPKAHFSVAVDAVRAGKHVYNEKPLTIDPRDALTLLREADRNGVLVGGAPDTFLGAGLQTCRKAIDDGLIGKPVAAQAFMMGRGHESWHPAPEFYYQAGGGPMLDMGPYYVTALVHLLGGVRRVTGSVRASFSTRTITSQPRAGTVVPVETPTHIVGVLDFAGGAIGEITTSFDVYHASLPPITIYGSEGTLAVPDPNDFRGPVRLRRAGDAEWTELPLTHGFAENSRGLGVLDMAYAVRTGTLHRASGALALHALDVMQGITDASDAGRHVEIASVVERPEAMGTDLYGGELERATA